MKNIHILLSSLLILVLIVLLALWRSSGSTLEDEDVTSQIENNNENKLYAFSDLNFKLNVPKNYTINEQSTRVVLVSKSGSVVINRLATDFENLYDHLIYIDEKNNIRTLDQNDLSINEVHAKNRLIEYPDETREKEVVFLVDGYVYSIETKEVELYDDLDQIAKSFQYTP